MKAKDYLEKHLPMLHEIKKPEDAVNIAVEIYIAMMQEISDLAEKRDIKRMSSLASIVDEVNSKWNSLCRMIQKTIGYSILKPNQIRDDIIEQSPELKKEFERRQNGR